MKIEEGIGPFGQQVTITYNPSTNSRELAEVYQDASRTIFLNTPNTSAISDADPDSINVIPTLARFMIQRVVFRAPNGLIQLSAADRRNFATDISTFVDENFFDRSPSRNWSQPVLDALTIDFTRKEIKNPLSNDQIVRVRYSGDKLIDCLIITDRRLIGVKEAEYSGKLESDIPTILRLIGETSEEELNLNGFATNEGFKMDLYEWELDEDDPMVLKARQVADELVTSYLANYFPIGRTKEECIKLLKDAAAPISITNLIVREVIQNWADIDKFFLTPAEMKGQTEADLEAKALYNNEFAKRLSKTRETIRMFVTDQMITLPTNEVIREKSLTYLEEMDSVKAAWGKYEMTNPTGLREKRKLIQEGINTYPFSIKVTEKGTLEVSANDDILGLDRLKGRDRLWKIQFPLTIPSRIIKQLFFDPDSDIRLIKEFLRMDFR